MIKVGAGGAEVSSTIRGGVRTPFLGFASDPPAALYQAAVTGDERDAEDVVAHRAEALAQRPRGRGGHDGAERAPGEAGRIEREPGAAVGELLAQQVAADPRLGGGGEVLRLDRGDAV